MRMSTALNPTLADYTRSSWRRGLALYLEHPFIHAGRWFGFVSRRAWPGRLVRFTDDDGHRYVSLKNNFTSMAVAVLGQRDPNVMRFLRQWIRPGQVICDVGANIGTYTLPLAQLAGPSGHVLAFEPNRSTRACLRQNLRQNQIRNATVVAAAAGAEPGRGSLVVTPANLGEVHLATDARAAGPRVTITTVDRELARLGYPRVHFIKLDVEGFELAVLRGATRALAASPDVVVQTEIVPAHAARYGFTLEDLTAFFATVGLMPHACDDRGRMIPLASPLATGSLDVFWARDLSRSLRS